MKFNTILKGFMIAIFTFPIFVFTSLCNQDTLFLKDGSVLVGKILDFEEGKEYEIRSEQGDRYIFTQDQIQKVDLTRFIETPIVPIDYEFGCTFGTPALFNLVIAKHFGVHAVRFSGNHFDSGTYGVHLEYIYKFAQFSNSYHALNVGLGNFNWKERYIDLDGSTKWSDFYMTYLGIAYNFNYRGFYVQAGIAINNEPYDNYMPMGQIGYVYQFRQ